MAYRTQTSVPELANINDEPVSTFNLYGDAAKEPGTHAYNCLMARRMANAASDSYKSFIEVGITTVIARATYQR